MPPEKQLVAFGEQVFFDYYPSSAPRPYIDALFTPAGRRLTRDLATAPSGSEDHLHHRGLWWGHRNVSGSDIWTEFDGHGSIRSNSEPILTTTPETVEILHQMTWHSPDGRPLVHDTRTLRGYAADANGARILDVELKLCAASDTATLSDTKEAGLVALRVAPEMEERRGGRITLSTGATGEGEAWGKPAKWCHYFGTIDGAEAGIAVFDHPDNPLPAYWHVRDYGLLAVNPFGLKDFDDTSRSGAVTLTADSALHSRYRILVHDGSVEVDTHYDAYLRGL
jgi:Methane oxygenase PmoA